MRTRFAQQMFRRHIEFSDSLSARERNSGADSPRLPPTKREKPLFYRLQTNRDGSPCVKGILVGLAVRTPLTAFNLHLKPLFHRQNFWRAGRLARCRPHTAAAPIACFLRNTFPKTAAGACDSGCSSLHVGTHWLRWRCDGGGNPKSTQPDDRG